MSGPPTRSYQGDKALSRRRWLAAAGGVLACGLGSALLGHRLAAVIPTGEKTGSAALRIRTFRVTHIVIRDGGKSRRRRGTFGVKSYGAWVGDGVQLEVEFSEPAYAYLLVFNPNPQVEKREEIQPESERDRPPSQLPRLEFPQGFGHYELSDGPGLQAFAVVASRKPLPAYAGWVGRRGDIGWKRIDSPRDVVWMAQGGNLHQSLAPEDPRGRVVAPAEADVLQELVRRLQTAPGVEAVSLVAFTVEPRP